MTMISAKTKQFYRAEKNSKSQAKTLTYHPSVLRIVDLHIRILYFYETHCQFVSFHSIAIQLYQCLSMNNQSYPIRYNTRIVEDTSISFHIRIVFR